MMNIDNFIEYLHAGDIEMAKMALDRFSEEDEGEPEMLDEEESGS